MCSHIHYNEFYLFKLSARSHVTTSLPHPGTFYTASAASSSSKVNCKGRGWMFRAIYNVYSGRHVQRREKLFCVIYWLLNYKLPQSPIGVVIERNSATTEKSNGSVEKEKGVTTVVATNYRRRAR